MTRAQALLRIPVLSAAMRAGYGGDGTDEELRAAEAEMDLIEKRFPGIRRIPDSVKRAWHEADRRIADRADEYLAAYRAAHPEEF